MDNWVTSIIGQLGYGGVALLMFLENLFPPIPSEVVMPLAGYTASQGDLSLWGVIAAGTSGSVLGAVFWYYVAHSVGEDRLKRWSRKHGRWLTIGPSDINRADEWFRRHGALVVFFGRLVPTIRTLVAIPAGLFEMPMVLYLVLTTFGSLAWTGMLAGVGWWLGSEWGEISSWLDPFTYLVLGAVVAIYLYRVATFARNERKAEARAARRR